MGKYFSRLLKFICQKYPSFSLIGFESPPSCAYARIDYLGDSQSAVDLRTLAEYMTQVQTDTAQQIWFDELAGPYDYPNLFFFLDAVQYLPILQSLDATNTEHLKDLVSILYKISAVVFFGTGAGGFVRALHSLYENDADLSDIVKEKIRAAESINAFQHHPPAIHT